MGRFAKLWGGIGGYVGGIILGVLVTYGLASCADAAAATLETCTIGVIGMEIPATVIQRLIEGIGLAIGIYVPTNKPA